MVGHLRLHNIRKVLESVVKNDVPGDFVEAGAWRGGACIYAKAVLEVLGEGQKRKVYAMDAFEPLPGTYEAADYLSVDIEAVRHNFEKYGLLDDNVKLVKGMFSKTVPELAASGNPIAVLRIDGNTYEAYQDTMYLLYKLIPIGGFVIFDDLGTHLGVQKFWIDFKKEQNLPEAMIFIDDNSAFFQKTQDVKLDWSFFRGVKPAGAPGSLKGPELKLEL
jgi:O-methyltransferase